MFARLLGECSELRKKVDTLELRILTILSVAVRDVINHYNGSSKSNFIVTCYKVEVLPSHGKIEMIWVTIEGLKCRESQQAIFEGSLSSREGDQITEVVEVPLAEEIRKKLILGKKYKVEVHLYPDFLHQ